MSSGCANEVAPESEVRSARAASVKASITRRRPAAPGADARPDRRAGAGGPRQGGDVSSAHYAGVREGFGSLRPRCPPPRAVRHGVEGCPGGLIHRGVVREGSTIQPGPDRLDAAAWQGPSRVTRPAMKCSASLGKFLGRTGAHHGDRPAADELDRRAEQEVEALFGMSRPTKPKARPVWALARRQRERCADLRDAAMGSEGRPMSASRLAARSPRRGRRRRRARFRRSAASVPTLGGSRVSTT